VVNLLEPDIRQVVHLLDREYSTPRLGNPSNPIDELIFILLSEKTDEAKHVEAFRRLKETFPQWEMLLSTPVQRIQATIKDAGMGARRALLLKRMLAAVVEKFGRLDLSVLATLTPKEAECELSRLPGIGPKASRCVLLYCFGFPVLPVDIHTYRLAIRLGILSRKIPYEKSHDVLERLIPPPLRLKFHVNAVVHGRARCFARNPCCRECPVKVFCSTVRAVNPLPVTLRPRPLAIDLFAGAGGLTLGFKRAGFQVVQAIESDPHAASTYAHNHREVDLLQRDLRYLDPRYCMQRLGLRRGEISVLIAGPPCQGFSESNRRTRTLENPRNHLYREVIRFLREIQPDFLVLENVAGLRTLARGLLLRRIVRACRRLGYDVAWRVLDASDFGVPQRRRRLFIVGSRGDAVSFPDPTYGPGHRRYVTVREAIGDLPRLRNGTSIDYSTYRKPAHLNRYVRLMRESVDRKSALQGNLVTKNADKIIARFRHIRPGENWEAIPIRLLDNYRDASRCHTGIYYRLEWKRRSKVIGNFRKNMLIHPAQHRGLSIREAARLQSFPDQYVFLGSIGFQQQQVADSVPPLLAEAVARCIDAKSSQTPTPVSTLKSEATKTSLAVYPISV
jgi:DNA (cytosine-5)-methyltransferase 1